MWVLARNLGEILREFGEILGKYRILDDSSLGSKGLIFPLRWASFSIKIGRNIQWEHLFLMYFDDFFLPFALFFSL